MEMGDIRRRVFMIIGEFIVLFVPGAAPVAAQSDGGENGGALGDIIVGALQELLRILFSPIRTVIENHGDAVL